MIIPAMDNPFGWDKATIMVLIQIHKQSPEARIRTKRLLWIL